MADCRHSEQLAAHVKLTSSFYEVPKKPPRWFETKTRILRAILSNFQNYCASSFLSSFYPESGEENENELSSQTTSQNRRKINLNAELMTANGN